MHAKRHCCARDETTYEQVNVMAGGTRRRGAPRGKTAPRRKSASRTKSMPRAKGARAAKTIVKRVSRARAPGSTGKAKAATVASAQVADVSHAREGGALSSLKRIGGQSAGIGAQTARTDDAIRASPRTRSQVKDEKKATAMRSVVSEDAHTSGRYTAKHRRNSVAGGRINKTRSQRKDAPTKITKAAKMRKTTRTVKTMKVETTKKGKSASTKNAKTKKAKNTKMTKTKTTRSTRTESNVPIASSSDHSTSGKKSKRSEQARLGTAVKRVPKKMARAATRHRGAAGSPEVLRSHSDRPITPRSPQLVFSDPPGLLTFVDIPYLQYGPIPDHDQQQDGETRYLNQGPLHFLGGDVVREELSTGRMSQTQEPQVQSATTPALAPALTPKPRPPSAAQLPFDKDAPLVSLWIGVFAHASDDASALDVFNGIDFTTILESEEGGGTAQRFDYTTHRFGTCHVVRLSRRLAHAYSVNRVGRFFLVDVPVARSPHRDTVYHCDISFPPNDVIPPRQNGLRFPTAMRFATRALTEHDGYPGKTPLHFHSLFRG
eukprot:IDg15619t1